MIIHGPRSFRSSPTAVLLPRCTLRDGRDFGSLFSVVLFDFRKGLCKVTMFNHVVSIKNCARPMAGNSPGGVLIHPAINEVFDGRSAQIVEQPTRQTGGIGRRFPAFPEFFDALAVMVEYEFG